MRAKKVENCLLRVKNCIQVNFRKLSCQQTYVKDQLEALVVTKNRLDVKDCLTGYLPSLGAIVETFWVEDRVTVITKLVNFQGFVVDTEKLESEITVCDSKILQSLNNGDSVHCQGLPWIKGEKSENQAVPCLVERVGKSIIRRSFDCQIVVAKRGGGTKCQSCLELCSKLEENCQDISDAMIKSEGFSDGEDEFENDIETESDEYVPIPVIPMKQMKKMPKKNRMEPFDEVCKICLQRYNNEVYFRKDQIWHEKTIGSVNESVKCPICHTLLEAKRLLTDHFTKAHPELGTCCCVCLSVLPLNSSNTTLRNHFLEHHNEPVKTMVVCPTCGGSFTKKYLDVHIALKHTKVKSYVCEDCGKAFATENVLKSHRRSFHSAKDMQCTQCEKKFLRKPLFLQHLQLHTGKKPYQCSECDYRSCRAYNVGLHAEKKHGKFLNIKKVIILPQEKDEMDSIVDEYLKVSNLT